MDRLRVVAAERLAPLEPCCRCQIGNRPWDRIAGKPYCPACQEELALGEGSPLVERTEATHCAACDRVGTIRFLTFPLSAGPAVEMDLCPEHFRRLLGRRLGPHAFHEIRRQLDMLELNVDDVFLLHRAFYDCNGQALLPAIASE